MSSVNRKRCKEVIPTPIRINRAYVVLQLVILDKMSNCVGSLTFTVNELSEILTP
jgi:hypothetical protein